MPAELVMKRAACKDHNESTESHEFSTCYYMGLRLFSLHMAFLYPGAFQASDANNHPSGESGEMLFWSF